MTARWAYEALAVNQFVENDYQKPIFKTERVMRNATFKKDLWLKDMENALTTCEYSLTDTSAGKDARAAFELIVKEFSNEQAENPFVKTYELMQNPKFENIDKKMISDMKSYLSDLSRFYIKQFNDAYILQQTYVREQTKTDSLNQEYTQLRMDCYNERLADFVTNKNEFKKTFIYKDRVIRRTDMIYQYPKRFLKAHFYAPKKRIFGLYYETYSVNLVVIWTYTLFLMISLQYSWLGKFLELPKVIKALRHKRKAPL